MFPRPVLIVMVMGEWLSIISASVFSQINQSMTKRVVVIAYCVVKDLLSLLLVIISKPMSAPCYTYCLLFGKRSFLLNRTHKNCVLEFSCLVWFKSSHFGRSFSATGFHCWIYIDRKLSVVFCFVIDKLMEYILLDMQHPT